MRKVVVVSYGADYRATRDSCHSPQDWKKVFLKVPMMPSVTVNALKLSSQRCFITTRGEMWLNAALSSLSFRLC
ncbi:hypothetical protein TorRG33x02_289600 [Trema orientale]|uniref:Uncharacterized protein n=1 Tax=Trema orientale TaxID=63057 RepID=A0A2P5CD46_TREOI|nr:hypothetical protein TorRG33x02_289600 [Trema orientale]